MIVVHKNSSTLLKHIEVQQLSYKTETSSLQRQLNDIKNLTAFIPMATQKVSQARSLKRNQ